MKIFLALSVILLLAGCTKSSTKPQYMTLPPDCRVFSSTPNSGIVCFSEQTIWLEECVNEMVRNKSNKECWFNGMGANDVVFIPKTDFAGEIFQKCNGVRPIVEDKVSVYKKWLEDRILEIQRITPGITRKQVDHVLDINGGICTSDAAIYSHIECPVLKVRIEFEPVSNKHEGSMLSDDDKVNAVSTPYLGYFIAD
jgi:hypothetical protein